MFFPDKPGVYLFKNRSGQIVYVGKAKSLKKRLASYFSRKIDNPKIERLLAQYDNIDYIVAKSELEALLLEAKLIKEHHPLFNVAFKDDKQYPYLKLSLNEEWPRLLIIRKKTEDGALYFGPFEGRAVRETIRQIKRLFPLCWCKKFRRRSQPCLHYYLKHCLSPCTRKVSHENYMSICRAVAAFLSGDLALTIEKLRTEMLRLARLRRFEEAGRFRDKIKNLKRLLQKQEAGLLFKRHEFKWAEEALALLKKTIKLDHDPKRIEAFDISNIMGKNMVGSMAVFENGLPRKSDYRRFMIRTVKEKPNDVAAIFEVVLRRYTGTLKDKLALPDLVLIDGGIAQVRSAKAALDAAGQKYLPVLGLAKKNEEIFLPEKNSPLLLGRDSPALQLLQRIRDEAHRFALKYHQQKRRLQSGN